MNNLETPIVGFAAWSGTGKTTLLLNLIGIFVERNIKVAVIKHAHHTFEIDYPGKDSYELRKAGASQVLVGSRKRWALIAENNEEHEPGLEKHLVHLDQSSLDLILVEGYKPFAIPKIELHRHSMDKPLMYTGDKSIIAIATDDAQYLVTDLPILDLNNFVEIADFIIGQLMSEDKTDA
jgi:molybdopterin-guanine dinucleotide biosynthesis protein MobB